MSETPIDVAERTLTLEEYRALPEEDGNRVELVRGRLVREPRPGGAHGWLAVELIVRIESYARKHDLGRTVTEAGFLLADEPPTVRGPDVAFISAEELPPDGPPEGYWRQPPDLAIEVVSPSNTAAGIQAKVLEYLDAGTRMVWVVDPGTESVTAYRSREEIRVLTAGEAVEGGDVLSSFRMELSELFER